MMARRKNVSTAPAKTRHISRHSVRSLAAAIVMAGVALGGGGNSVLATSSPALTGTVLLDIRSGQSGSYPRNFTAVGGKEFFTAKSASGGTGLWVSTGTRQGTKLVKVFHPEINSNGIGELTPLGKYLFFLADDGVHGQELWISNGLAGGTHMVKDIYPGSASCSCSNLTPLGNELLLCGAGFERLTGSAAGQNDDDVADHRCGKATALAPEHIW